MAEYKLEFFAAAIPHSEHSRILHIPYANKAFAISNDTLYEFQFSNGHQPTITTTKDNEYPLGDAKLLFVEPVDDIQTAIIVKTIEGIRIYLHSKNTIRLVVEDDQFHDALGWNKPGNDIHFGHFYHDPNILGMMSSHSEYGTKFYAIFKDILLSGEFPIYPLDTNDDIFKTYSPNSLNQALVSFKRNSRRSVLSRNREGLSLFELNESNGIDFVMKIPHCGSSVCDEGIFFTDLTHQKYNDIVHFNSSGMFVYQYNDGYKFIHYNALFSEEKGWTPHHTKTIRFVDVNLDGYTDMVFTGPKGIATITYKKHTNLWDLVIETASIPPNMRHAQVMRVIPKTVGLLNDSYIMTHLDGSIKWSKIIQLPESPPLAFDIHGFPTKTVPKSSTTPLLTPSPKSFENTPLLRDMNIWSDILNCVNRETGKPKFSLPLVNLPEPALKLILQYDATNGVNDVLGFGWSMPLNLIAMDDSGSIFDDDAVFVIAFQDSPQALKFLPNESTSIVRTYILQSRNQGLKFRAKFYTNDDQWVVDLGNGIQQIYGQIRTSGEGALSNDIIWKSWHGAGFDSTNQLERTRMWYLARVQDEQGRVLLEFFYDTDIITVNSGLSYTRAVYAKKFRDYQGNEIEFRYKEKENNEYKTYDEQDKDGNYNWVPAQTRYMTGYTFTKPSNGRQTVSFEYNTSNGHRLLQEIHQSEDVIRSPVAKFEYLSLPRGKFGLKSALLPYDVKVDFTYAIMGDRHTSNVLKRIDVLSDYKVTTAEKYVLVSFINGNAPDQVVLRMFNRDMTEELYTSDFRVKSTTKGRWPLLGEYKSVVGHNVIRGDDYFAVILFYAYSKWLCLFGQAVQSDEWLYESKCHEYGEKAEIIAGKDFCLVSNPGSKVELFEWKSMQGTWKQKTIIEKADSVAVAVHGNKFVTYDNNEVSLGYKTRNGIWNHIKLAGLQNCLSETESIFKRFNLKEDFHKLISAAFRNNILKFSHNLVALNCLQINGLQLQSSLKLYAIDRRKKVSVHQEIIIDHDNLQTFISNEVEVSDGNFFKFRYEVQSNGDFYIKVVDFRGPLFEQAKTKVQKKEMRKQVEQMINSPAQRLLFDLQNYTMSLTDKVIICHNQKVTFGGNQWWQRGPLTKSEQNGESLYTTLGDNFILEKVNKETTVKLLQKSTRQVLSDLTVNLTDIRMFYPIYMATQQKGKPVRLIEFDHDKVNEKELPIWETLSPYTNPLMLITHQGEDRKSVIFRQQYGIGRFLPDYVVRQVAVAYDSDRKKRVTGYEYDTGAARLAGNAIVYSRCSIIPADDRTLYGWLEMSATNGSSVAYDNHGELVTQIPYEEERSNNDEESEEEKAFRKATTIYDKSGRLELANSAPYLPRDESVGYYGFEDYESNVIGTSKQWNFKTSNIIRNGFALTGKNYLQQKNEPIQGIFQPIDQNTEYLASSWIRLQNITEIPQIGKVTPYLKAIVLTTSGNEVYTLLSQIKFRLDDWIYLELIVDLPFIRKTIGNDFEDKLQIAIRVGPSLTAYTDIDHIRFAPLISDFSVRIFDSTRNLNTAVIQSTGAILRRTYDVYNSVVGKINEQNQIEEITVYTKGRRLTVPQCTIKVEPEMGFYEQFSPFSFANRWNITKVHEWMIAPYQLEHRGDERAILTLSTQDVTTESYGFRALYSLDGYHASLVVDNLVQLTKNAEECIIKANANDQSIPSNGEILMVKEKNRYLVWIDGTLYIDEALNVSDMSLTLSMAGQVSIKDMMVFSKPSVKVIYQNSFDEPTQEISLESAESIVVREKLYDELGRQRITTQYVRIVRSKFEPLLRYIPNFVTNDATNQPNSIWKTGLLGGLAANIIGHPYGFTETQYESNPLNKKTTVTLPGKDFSSSGEFAKRFTSKMTNLFVENRYPLSMNVSYQVELKPGDVEDITVLNRQNKKLAHFVHVPGGKDLFSTYKLNSDGNLLQALPPLYFERVGTFHKTNSDLLSVNAEDYRLQMKLGVHIEYDRSGKPIRKTTADAGPLENLYDSDHLLRFILHYSYDNPNLVETIIYFTYDQVGRLLTTGRLIDTGIHKDQLLSLTLNEKNSVRYQSFNYANFERDPNLRGRLIRTITMNGNEPFAEVMYVNERGATINKRVIVPNLTRKPDEISISTKYLGGRLQKIYYPATFFGRPFVVVYSYDRLGRVNSIGVPGDLSKFLQIAHNAAGHITEETYEPASAYTFKNLRDYNEPGFLTKLSNPFQSEEISYTEFSYGGANRGDGSVTRIKLSAKWHRLASGSGIGLSPKAFVNDSMSEKDSKTCFEALKNAGYLDDKNRQIKAFYPSLEIDFPIICTSGITGRHVSNVLGRSGFPAEHGYRFDYGAYQDLTKAKYFIGTDEPDPFQPDTFAKEIPGISTDSSHRMWKALKTGKFLIEDPDRTNLATSQGKESQKSIIGSKLLADLKHVSPDYAFYDEPLRKLLTSRYLKHQMNITLLQMQDIIRRWLGNSSTINSKVQRTAADIFEMLRQKRYFLNPLDAEFQTILTEFRNHFPEIVRVVYTYFGKQLGRSEFDIESYEIDANGNHRQFNTGYNHYSLKYERDSNRIEGVQYKAFDSSQPEGIFRMRHDSRGNVIEALHKGIASMEYHPVSNRLLRVEMIDGRIIEFYYDSKGERVLKRMKQPDGRVRKEMHYLRDDQGRTLVERELSFVTASQPPSIMVTMYIYGPNGLVGFIRRDQFFSVITDHQGSVRLIVRDGEVIAAYDYLPYGDAMRIFGADSEAHIPYRYTGQEWDPEIGLYNYHARFYDPTIGRFYQIDPKEQYFSPYKYAGNSPISMVDPSGEIAFMLVAALISAAIGAYLGGAAANGSFDPRDWELNLNTIVGVVLGGLTGLFLPQGLVASAQFLAVYIGTTAAYTATVSIGLGMAYFSAAAANGSLNYRDWDFSSPSTYNALFSGFAMGATAISGFNNVAQFYRQLDSAGKNLFIAAFAVSESGLFIMGGIATDWDLSKPQFWFATVSGVMAAPDLAQLGVKGLRGIQNGYRDIRTIYRNYNRYVDEFFTLHTGYGRSMREAFMDIYKSNYELGRIAKMLGTTTAVGISTYLVGSMLNDGFTNWNMTAVSTYQNLISAIQMGGQSAAVGKDVITASKETLRLRKSKNALLLTDEIADLSAQAYKWHIENNGFNLNEEHYNPTTLTRLAENEIPNTAMSVAVAGDIAIVGFSTNKAPGLYLIFDHDKLTNPVFRSEHIVDNNGELGGRPVAVRDDARLNGIISEVIHSVPNGIKQSNLREYVEGNGRQVLVDRANEMPWVNENVRNQFVTAIHGEIMKSSFVKKSFLEKQFDKTKFNAGNKRIRDAEMRLVQARRNLAAATNDEQRTLLTAERDRLIDVRTNLISSERANFAENLFQSVEHLREVPIIRDISNCAEPHTLLALERQNDIFGETYFNRKSYDIQHDIEFMATYKVEDLPDTPGFQRCSNCMESTSLIPNVLTDDEFMINLQRSAERAQETAELSKGQLSFLIPMINLHNTIEDEEKKKNVNDRQKRSLTSGWYDRSLGWIKSFKTLPNRNSNRTQNRTILELGDEFISKINLNGTLLLADIILAKCQHRKIYQVTNDTGYEVNSAELLCNVLQLFEDSVEEAADISGVSINQLNVDSYTMQQKVLPLLRKHQFKNISEIMLRYAMNGLDSGMTQLEIDNFRLAFESLQLNQTIENMFVKMEQAPKADSAIDMAHNAGHRESNTPNKVEGLGALLFNQKMLN